MGLLGLEVYVSIADRGDVRAVDVRVEVADARAADTQVVRKADVGGGAGVILDARRWD